MRSPNLHSASSCASGRGSIYWICHLWPLLLTWISFGLGTDMWLHPLCDYLSVLGLGLGCVSGRDHWPLFWVSHSVSTLVTCCCRHFSPIEGGSKWLLFASDICNGHLRMLLRFHLSTLRHLWFWWCLGAGQATGHYPNEWWPGSLTFVCV